MRSRRIAMCVAGAALLGTGATLLFAQQPAAPRDPDGVARNPRDRFRAEVVKLRVEVEMLQFDFELARNNLLDDLKMERGLKMVGPMIGAFSQMNVNPSGEPTQKKTDEQIRKEAEESRAAEKEEERQAAAEASVIADRKKELASLFKALSEKRLDLDEAERVYNSSKP